MKPDRIAKATRAEVEALIGPEATARFTVRQEVEFIVLAGQSRAGALAAILTEASGQTVTTAPARAVLENRNAKR